MTDEHSTGDRYSRVDYRRLIAWEARLEREAPFLLRQLEAGPDRSVLDLGCGTGEHVAFFAAQGARAVGIDSSESMIARAREHEQGRFLLGDALEVPTLLADEPPFGLALCLGNMLPHLQEPEELARFLTAAVSRLAPGGRLVLQILNYHRILAHGIRYLPLNVRPGDGDREIVFLRLMRPLPDGKLLFCPTTLELDPEADQPVRLERSKRVVLRPWIREDLELPVQRLGLEATWYGDMEGGDLDPDTSADLVLVARA